jgi:DNA-binding transcriptional LysR family regulator
MEHALGVRLLDRSQRGVEPTPYGRALIKRGMVIFDEMRQGIEEIEFLSNPTAGEVRSERPIRSMPRSWRRSSTGSHGNIRR